jgi:tetratricopeptide (TPR) repeat protein
MMAFLKDVIARRSAGRLTIPAPCQEMIRSARAHLDIGERDDALSIWRNATAQFPKQWLSAPPGLSVMLDLKQYDQAEEVMRAALSYEPKSPIILRSLVQTARMRGDIDEAVERCYQLRKLLPVSAESLLDIADLLIGLKKSAEAEKLLENSSFVFKEKVCRKLAELAMGRQDWGTAVKRWEEIAATSNAFAPILGAAICYKELEQFDSARAILVAALQRSAPPADIWLELARLAERMEEWSEAARLWHDIRLRMPQQLAGYTEGARVLIRLGQGSKARSVLRDAEVRFPDKAAIIQSVLATVVE